MPKILIPTPLRQYTGKQDTVQVQGGTLCTEGKWRARDGSASGTTPFRVFIKDGVTRRSP